jgi:hypothetical protein
MSQTPETLYLIPGEWDGEAGMVWCDDPAPDQYSDPTEAVKYLKAAAVRERLFQDWPGCTNHGCIVTGPKKAMGTNGRCTCMQNASRSQLNLFQQRLQAMLVSEGG